MIVTAPAGTAAASVASSGEQPRWPNAAHQPSLRPRINRGAAPADAAGSARTRTCRARPTTSLRTGPPQRGQGSPSRRWTRNPSWKEPRAPSRSRKSSMLAPLASIPACERLDDRRRQRLPLRARYAAGRAQRVHARAEQRLVGVDVPDAGDPALVEQERLHRRPAAARERAQVLGAEAGVEGLEAEARAQEGVERGAPVGELAGAEAARVDVEQLVAVVELEANAACGPAARPGRRAGSRSCAGAGAGSARR